MTEVAEFIFLIVAIIFSLMALVYSIELISALLFSARSTDGVPVGDDGRCVAVVIPAHNEATEIESTVRGVRKQLGNGDRVLVVADNCTDATAELARVAGAEVVERVDLSRRGKGYALDFGLKYLSLEPPDIVVFVDADSQMSPNLIETLAATSSVTGRPVQAKYLIVPPSASEVDFSVAGFAQIVKNFVRPIGLHNLGLPCQLTGSGMAFPWRTIQAAPLAHGHITEDLQLGLDLAHAGSPAVFCPSVEVKSEFPYSAQGAIAQRTRWERGHIQIIRSAWIWIWRAVVGRNTALLALALDMAVPPIALLVLVLAAIFSLSGVGALFGFSSFSLWLSGAALLAVLISTLLVWFRYGREVLPAHTLKRVLPYVVEKTSIYRGLLMSCSPPQWTRTDRHRPGHKP